MPTAIVSLTEFKAKAARMLAELKATEQEIVLTQRGAASAVVQDFDAYERQRSALLMLKLMAQGEADIQAGRTTPQDKVFAEIKARLTAPTDG
jgi:prevent-host-death family protein